jgi:hypothetical protein
MRMPNITEGVKKLLGNTKGPTTSEEPIQDLAI